MKCVKCNEELVMKKVVLEYLGHQMTPELPCCPKCGQVFVSEELANGKMKQVELTLEDK